MPHARITAQIAAFAVLRRTDALVLAATCAATSRKTHEPLRYEHAPSLLHIGYHKTATSWIRRKLFWSQTKRLMLQIADHADVL